MTDTLELMEGGVGVVVGGGGSRTGNRCSQPGEEGRFCLFHHTSLVTQDNVQQLGSSQLTVAIRVRLCEDWGGAGGVGAGGGSGPGAPQVKLQL